MKKGQRTTENFLKFPQFYIGNEYIQRDKIQNIIHAYTYFNVFTVHKFKIGHSLPYFDMYISLARQVRNIRKLNVLLCLLGTDLSKQLGKGAINQN